MEWYFPPPPEKSQAKTVDLSMASGNQVIAPDDGYSLSEVTVTKPATLTPENIKKDVDIGGVVGTMEGGVSGKRSVTFSNGGPDRWADIYYIEDGVFKTAKIGTTSENTTTIAADYSTTIYVNTGMELFTFIPIVEGATATNYIEESQGKTQHARLMYILE